MKKSIAILSLICMLAGCELRPAFAEQGYASWYGNESIVTKWGGYTRNGDKFDENKLTCALPTKQGLNRWYKITNLRNGKSVIVFANDTGSFAKYGRIVDLSKAAFKILSPLEKGVIKVNVERINETS